VKTRAADVSRAYARLVEHGGAGLALAIIRAVIEAHTSKVDVRKLDRGCEFRLRLPAF